MSFTVGLLIWDLLFLPSTRQSILVLLIVEILFFPAWLLYWTIIYPKYLTAFRHLPTPAVSSARILMMASLRY